MPINLREIINVSLVLLNHDLLGDNEKIQEFQQAVDVDVRLEGGMAANIATGETHPNRILHLDRDRIALNMSKPRSVITKEFPAPASLDEELSRFAEIAERAFTITGLPKEERYDFGYNADMVFDQDTGQTALEFLGKRILNHSIFNETGRQFVGGACRMTVIDEHGQWNFTLEPRAGDLQRRRVFVGTNLHNDQRRLPDKREITTAIGEVVNSVKDLMRRLDE